MKIKAIINKKVFVWQRLEIEFEANDETHAKELLAQHNGVPSGAEFNDTETLFQTEENVYPEDNRGKPVYEVIEMSVESD